MKKTLLFFTLLLLLSSCTKERRVLNADVVFFYDDYTDDELSDYNDLLWGAIDRLDYYIEEEPGTFIQVGSEYPTPLYDEFGNFIRNDFYYSGIPLCYQDTYVTSPIEWYTHSSTTINYMVYGVHEVDSPLGVMEFETIVDEYSFTLYANECAAVQITFLNKKRE